MAAAGGEAPRPPLGDARTFAAIEVALTDAGQAVLDGAADRVELSGSTFSLGGTHLHTGHVPAGTAPPAGRLSLRIESPGRTVPARRPRVDPARPARPGPLFTT